MRVNSRLLEPKKERLLKERLRDLGANLVIDSGMASGAQHWKAPKIMHRRADSAMNLDEKMATILFEEV